MRNAIILMTIVVASCFADTTYVSGAVSGVWDTSGSPYVIEDSCYIDSTETLEIGAGTEILFADDAEMLLYGNIKAFGEESHRVVFRNLDSTGHWLIERKNFAGDSCSDTFALCIFENGYLFQISTFWSYSAQKCVFDNCRLYSSGRLIDCEICNYIGSVSTVSGNEELVNCLIHHNSIAFLGYSDPSYISEIPCLYNCTIVDNDTGYVFIDGYWIFSPEIVNCIFARNAINIEGNFNFENVLFDTLYPWEAYCTTSSDIVFIGDPMFVAPDLGDFHLRDSSMAIGLCDTSYFIPDHDLDGNPRPNPAGSIPDLGCYENPRAIADAIGESDKGFKPLVYSISAFPNPFNSSVKITIAAGVGASDARSGQVGIQIFDMNGRLVADLPVTTCGSPQVVPTPRIWQPDKSLGSGVYLVRARAGGASITKRVVYLR